MSSKIRKGGREMRQKTNLQKLMVFLFISGFFLRCGNQSKGPPPRPPEQGQTPSAVPTLLCEWTTGNFGNVYASRDGTRITVLHDFKIELYDTQNCQQLWQQPLGPRSPEIAPIFSFDASDDLGTVAVLYDNPEPGTKLEIYDTVRRQPLGVREKKDSYVMVSPSGNYLVLQGKDERMSFGDEPLLMVLNRSGVKLWEGGFCGGYPLDMSMSYDAEYITCDLDVYDRSGNWLWQAAPSDTEYMEGTNPTAEIAAQISPNGQYAAFTYAEFFRISYTARYHFQLRTISGQVLWDKNAPMFDMRFTDDGSKLLTLAVDGLYLFDTQGNQLWHFNPGFEQSMMSDLIALSSDGKVVSAILYPVRDYEESGDLIMGLTPTVHTLYVLNGLTGAVLWQSPLGDLGLVSVSMSADGHILAIQGNNLLRIYDLSPLVQTIQTGGRLGPPGGLSP